jgi:glycosyltransferase 2 family protein
VVSKKLAINVSTTVVKWLLLSIVLVFVVWVLKRDISKIDDWSNVRPDWAWVALSSLMTFAAGLCVLVSYRTLVHAYGGRATWRQMIAIAWLPALGKYLPLRIWAMIGAVVMLRQIGISAAVAVGVVLMMDAFSVVMGLLFATPLLAHPAMQLRFGSLQYFAAVGVVIGVVVLHPRVSGSLVNFTLKKLKKEPLDTLPTVVQCLPSIVAAFFQWVCAGLSLWAMLNAFVDVGMHQIPVLCAIAAGAMTIGYLSLIAPVGLGVREALLLFSLKLFLPEVEDYIIAVVVVLLRIQQTLIEVLQAGVGWWLKRTT